MKAANTRQAPAEAAGELSVQGLSMTGALPQVTLVENFALDGQESMKRFSDMLKAGLESAGVEFQSIAPQPVFARLVRKYRFSGFPKWLGYIDKLAVFPRALARLEKEKARLGPSIVHIVDHSNAPYSKSIRRSKSLVTCHDLLAVRGALGDDSVDCPATWSGRQLQLSILRGLARADRVACVSRYTQSDLVDLLGRQMLGRSEVVHNGINHSYSTLDAAIASRRVAAIDGRLLAKPYLLHVGSNLKRKNKPAALRALASIKDSFDGYLVFCGPAIPQDLRSLAVELGIADRVINVVKPDNDALEALYNCALAFLFPSTSEGFGWPVIEAQACGCPVICSDRTAIPEVAGDGAIICGAEDPKAIGQACLGAMDAALRKDLREKGFENVKRFGAQRMVDDYVHIYRTLASG